MRSFLVVCCIILGTFNAYSQGFKGGITGGLLVSQIDGDKSSGYEKIGFHAGVFSKYYFDKQIALTFKLRYITKGSSFTSERGDQVLKIKLNYIELPVGISYPIFEKFKLNGGLAFAFLIKPTIKDETGTLASDRIGYKKLDINAFAGLEYVISERISVNLEYAYSLLAINENFRRQYNNLIIAGLDFKF